MSTFSKMFLRNRSKAPDRLASSPRDESVRRRTFGVRTHPRPLCEKVLRLTAMWRTHRTPKAPAHSLDENLISLENATADMLRQNPTNQGTRELPREFPITCNFCKAFNLLTHSLTAWAEDTASGPRPWRRRRPRGGCRRRRTSRRRRRSRSRRWRHRRHCSCCRSRRARRR